MSTMGAYIERSNPLLPLKQSSEGLEWDLAVGTNSKAPMVRFFNVRIGANQYLLLLCIGMSSTYQFKNTYYHYPCTLAFI